MRVGSLFSGYGGLDLAVGGELAWYSEIEPAACKVLAAHHPDVPNLGDITKVNWNDVPPVDVLTAGYPCQPFSTAGYRKGTNDERHLWPYVRDAIGAIRPKRAVLENVRGHLSLGFDIVLADLAHMGWSAQWGVVRASDVGAPHQRARLFIVADSASTERGATEPDHLPPRRATEPRERAGAAANPSRQRHGSRERPPGVGRVGGAAEGSRWDSGATWQEPGTGSVARWGAYAPAINRWQHVIKRIAPAPTVERAGRDRLNPKFVEWMMGLPEGWVTGHGLNAAQELKMLGNGVVPQQARLALDLLVAA